MLEDEQQNEIQLVVFKLGAEEFGVDISQVREIIKTVDITRMPDTPEFVEGVINLRGAITLVMDLRKKLGITSEDFDKDARIVIIELESNIIGMMVDSVAEVLRISSKDIDTETMNASQIGAEYIRGVGKLEDRILILLDLRRVLTGQEVAQVELVVEEEVMV